MSSNPPPPGNIPPEPNFSGIIYNTNFFKVSQTYLTETIANTKYLKLVGGSLTGFLGIGKTAAVELDVAGKACIDTSLGSTPAIGIYGGNATRLILGKGSETEYPKAIGCDATDLWLGTNLTGTISFYTGNGKRLTISPAQIALSSLMNFQMNNGIINLGGTSNSAIYLTSSGTSAFGVANSVGQFSGSSVIGDTVLRAQATKKLLLQSGTGDAAITILDNGYIGIGTNNPINLLHLHANATSQYIYLRMTDNTSGITNTDGIAIVKTDVNDMFLIVQEAARIMFFTNNTIRITISSGGETYVEKLLVVGNNDNIPNLQMGSVNGYNLGISKPTAGIFSTSAAIGDMVLRSSQNLLLQSGIGNCAMCINTNNYVQIGYGYTTATYPITLRTTEQVQQSIPGTYAYGNVAIFSANLTGPVAPYIGIGILNMATFSSGFYIYSDKRIKKDIKPIENSLDLIEKINLVSFKFIDHIEKGTINNYGVIAQEIEEIIPEVINKHKDYIPNIYKNVDYYDEDENKIYIKTNDLSIGDKIKIYDSKNKEHLKEVIGITDNYITIDSSIENYEKDSPVFLYGKEIPDVKNVNYEALFIINMKATQEIYKRLQKLEKYFNIVY